jgi:hypothetical protein
LGTKKILALKMYWWSRDGKAHVSEISSRMFATSKKCHTRSITTRRESLHHDQRFMIWANEPVHSFIFF